MPNLSVNTPVQTGNTITYSGTTLPGTRVDLRAANGTSLAHTTSDVVTGAFSISFTVSDNQPAAATVAANGKVHPLLSADFPAPLISSESGPALQYSQVES